MKTTTKILSLFSSVALAATVGALAPATAFAADNVTRIGGADRFETANLIFKTFMADSAKGISLVNGYNFPDALSAGSLSAQASYAIVPVTTNSIPATSQDTINAVPSKQFAYIWGGNAAVSEAIGTQATSAYGDAYRAAGSDRYATSLLAAYTDWEMDPAHSSKVYLASGAKFADALSGGVLAARDKANVVLVPPTGISAEVAQAFKDRGIRDAVILGGKASVSGDTESTLLSKGIGSKRIAGSDRYETSKKILEAGWGQGYSGKVIYASGENYADALAAVPAAYKMGVPIMLTGKTSTTQPMSNPGWVVGGPNAVADGAWSTKQTKQPSQPAQPSTPTTVPSNGDTTGYGLWWTSKANYDTKSPNPPAIIVKSAITGNNMVFGWINDEHGFLQASWDGGMYLDRFHGWTLDKVIVEINLSRPYKSEYLPLPADSDIVFASRCKGTSRFIARKSEGYNTYEEGLFAFQQACPGEQPHAFSDIYRK